MVKLKHIPFLVLQFISTDGFKIVFELFYVEFLQQKVFLAAACNVVYEVGCKMSQSTFYKGGQAIEAVY